MSHRRFANMGQKEDWSQTLGQLIDARILPQATFARRCALIWALVATAHGLEETKFDTMQGGVWRILCASSQACTYIGTHEKDLIVALNAYLSRHKMPSVRKLNLSFAYFH